MDPSRWLMANRLIFTQIFPGYCRELVFPEFSSFAHKRLVNHDIETLQVNDFDMCQLRCYQDPNCVSINFNVNHDCKGLHDCELNNATHVRHDKELKDKTDYVYHGTLVRTKFSFSFILIYHFSSLLLSHFVRLCQRY